MTVRVTFFGGGLDRVLLAPSGVRYGLQGPQKVIQLLVVHLVKEILSLSCARIEGKLKPHRRLRETLHLVARQRVLEIRKERRQRDTASVSSARVSACVHAIDLIRAPRAQEREI